MWGSWIYQLEDESYEFIATLKGRDPDVFSLLYDRYGNRIYNLAYRMTGNAEDASDITQETFLSVYRNIDTFRGDSKLYTWMYAITRHLCYRYFIKQKKTTIVSLENLIHEATDEHIHISLTPAEKQSLLEQVKEGCLTVLLRCLTFYQRMAFILHALLHLPVRDVSAILEKSEGATRVLVFRARDNLKKFLCSNCSLYDPANPCRCENLIGFSLRNGWISLDSGRKHRLETIDTRKIEGEIRTIRSVIELYTSLDAQSPCVELKNAIQELIGQEDWLISKI